MLFFTCLIILIKPPCKRQIAAKPPAHFRNVFGLFHLQPATQQPLFTVAQPLLYHLIPADVIVPHVGRNILPVRRLIEINIKRLFAKLLHRLLQSLPRCLCPRLDRGKLFLTVLALDDLSLARHRNAVLAPVSPSGSQFQFALVRMQIAPADLAYNPYRAKLFANRAAALPP